MEKTVGEVAKNGDRDGSLQCRQMETRAYKRECSERNEASAVEEKFEMYEHEREREEWRRSGESKNV
jgi:hypothetical protein